MTSASRISTLLRAVACATTLIVGACSGNSFTDCTAVYTCAGGNGGASAGNGGTTSGGGGSSAGTGGESGGIGGASGSAGASGAQTGGAAGSDLGGAGGTTGGTGGTTGGAGASTGGAAGTATGGSTGTGGTTSSGPLWLAYLSSAHLPYLADVSKSTFPKVDLSSVIGPGCAASQLSFSPDGHTVAFVAGTGSSCALGLFLVDVSGTTPSAATQVDAGGVCDVWGWSGNGRWLAYSDTCPAGSETTWTSNILVVDTSSSAFGARAVIGTAQSLTSDARKGVWATSGVAWLDSTPQAHYVVFNGADWVNFVNTPMSVTGSYVPMSGGADRMLLKRSDGAGTVLRFGAGNAYTQNSLSASFYSPDLAYVLTANASSTAMDLIPLAGVPPVGSFAQGTSGVWSNDSKAMIALKPLTAAGYVTVSSSFTNTTISNSSSYTTFRFSSDGSRIGMGSSTQIAASNVTGVSTTAPVVVSKALPNGGTLTSNFGLSPDDKSIWYIGQQTTAGVSELYSVDLSGTTPGAPRKLNAPLGSGVNVSSAGFTSDSAHAFYTAGTSLYLVDMSPETAVGTLVLSSFDTYVFQP